MVNNMMNEGYGMGLIEDGYGIGKPTSLTKDGHGLGSEGWDGACLEGCDV